MSYSVCAYLTEADKVKSVYGTCDNQLMVSSINSIYPLVSDSRTL